MKKTTFFILTLLIFSTIGLQTTPAQVIFEHGDSVYSVAFSPVDNTLLASGSSDGTVKLWDVVNQTDVATLEGHVGGVTSVAFSPNGMLLASGSGDGTVKLWEVGTHQNIAMLEGHAVGGTSIAFSPDGTTLAAGASDGIVKLWDVATHQNTATFGGYDAATVAAIVAAENQRHWFTPVSFLSNTTLAAGSGDRIKLWDVATEETIATFEVPGDLVISMACSPDGTTLAAGTYNSIIKLWDVATRTNTTTFPSLAARSAWFEPPPFISFSPDGALLAFTSTGVALWNIETGTQTNALSGHTRVVRSVSFSPDGSILASGAQDGTVRLWDPSSLQPALTVSTALPLTEATLHGSVVILTLTSGTYKQEIGFGDVSMTVSGIDGITIGRWGEVERLSDTEVAVPLEFDRTDFDTDATLTFTVDADAIVDPQHGLSVQVPVPVTQVSNATVSISPLLVVSPAVGEELRLSLNIKGGENVAGYQAIVSFDSTALQPIVSFDPEARNTADSNVSSVSFTNGDYLPAGAFFADPIIVEEWLGDTPLGEPIWSTKVILAANTLAGAANGDGTLATLMFEVVDFKPSTLTLSQLYLVDTDGKRWEATTQNGTVTVPPEPAVAILGDINRDGVVNIQDLVIVAARFGQRGHNSADLNGDGLVDTVDLVLVAGEFGGEAAAPSAQPQVLELLNATDLRQWLSQAQQLALTDPAYLRGITVLEQLHAALIPQKTVLLPNYPNPFNPETWIPYRLTEGAFVTLTIYDSSGGVVRTLEVGHRVAAFYESRSKAIHWDGRNEFGEQVGSGVYFYHLSAGDYSATRKMLILK